MSSNTEYVFDIAAFQMWQREQNHNNEIDGEAFKKIVMKVIQNELNEKERKVLYLYFFEEHTLKEIAELKNVSTVAIWKQLKSIERKLYGFLKYAAELYYGRAMWKEC